MSRPLHYWLRALAIVAALFSVARDWTPVPPSQRNPPIEPGRPSVPLLAATAQIGNLAPLFPSVGESRAPAGDAERLEILGIAGRLPDDAEVLVRQPGGKATTLRLGETVIGWTLVAVTANNAVFERGGNRSVLTLKPPP